MTDAYQDGIWIPILLIVAAFALGKVLAALGVLTSQNFDTTSKAVSAAVGILYALLFNQANNFGAVAWIISIGAGVMVAVVSWVFIVMGIGASLPVDFQKSAAAPGQQEEQHKGELL